MNSVPVTPPVTDELPIAIRAYVAPSWREFADPNDAKPKAKSKPPMPASQWSLVFDTETTTGAAQALRFGTYQLRKAGDVKDAGIFYDPDGVSPDELKVLQTQADANGLNLRTRESFVDDVFYKSAWQMRATIIGFNLPFDIARLAISHGTARTPQSADADAMRGGFTFKLSAQKIYPNIRVKHMSSKAALISFAKPMGQPDSPGQRNRGIKTGVRRGHFIDVKTLANALFAKGFSLSSLSRFLQVPNPKLEFEDFDGPINDDMVRYAVRDVQATWECYAELIGRYDALKLTKSAPEKIYSEAGIGKGYIREMGIAPWRKMEPDFPPDLIAKIMGSYFGGRSEVRIRREIRQVILCDFLSMYPTVCTLMGLWRFVIADGMNWRDATADTRNFLASADLAALQSAGSWQKLATLVCVQPDADIFPVRAAYSGEAQRTIGANYLTADTPQWFTLADCIAAKLLTGKAPQIIEAISFAPKPVQSGLEAIDIAGNPQYRVDPNSTDFFKRVIELRQSVKKRRDQTTGDEWTRLDIDQNQLKICANSTSYGIWVEVNVDDRQHNKSVTVHSSTGAPFAFDTDKLEMPGTYFHPLLATLITGAARLMLAITERLLIDRGLDWAFCDTDSMAIAKPAEMPGEEFASRAASVVDWFASLNPYEFDGSILKVEDVNASLETGGPQPLHCFAISSKRYALFNLASYGTPIMRKVSAHGLGHLLAPYGEADAPSQFPVPHKSVLKDGTVRWHCDFWLQIVSAALNGKPDQLARDYHPALQRPAISRYGATSPDLLQWFKTYNADRSYRDQVKPFGFLLAMSGGRSIDREGVIATRTKGRRKKVPAVKPVAPFDTNHEKAVAAAFDRKIGLPIEASSLRNYADALEQYHISPESKFLNARFLDRGTTQRRHIRMATVQHVGKEAHDWERQAFLGMNPESDITYGVAGANLASKLTAMTAQFGETQTAKALAISKMALAALVSGSLQPVYVRLANTVAKRLPAALATCAKLHREKGTEIAGLRAAILRDGLRETARRLGVDPSNLRRRMSGLS
jgi:hypothetical protein